MLKYEYGITLDDYNKMFEMNKKVNVQYVKDIKMN